MQPNVVEAKSVDSLKDQVIEETLFLNCDLSQADLRNVRLSNCAFRGCNLALTKFDGARLHSVLFDGCKLSGIGFDLCEQKGLFSFSLKDSLLQYCSFAYIKQPKLSLTGCRLHHCNFTGAKLEGANFRESDLLHSVFHDTDLSKSDFRDAYNYLIDPLTNRLTKAKFSFPECVALLRALDIDVELA